MNTAPEEHLNMKHEENEETDTVATVSENSPIRLGVILGLFSVCVATIGAAWYLASSLSKIETKLDVIGAQVTSAATTAGAIDRRQSEHEREDNNMWRGIETRVSIIERIGSPKLPELEKKLNELENEIKGLQMAMRNGTKP